MLSEHFDVERFLASTVLCCAKHSHPCPGLAMSDVTRILSAIEQGDPRAAGELLPLVYEELRKLAAVRLAAEKPGQTLQATALVHEAYVRLVGGGKEPRTEESKNQGKAGERGREPEVGSPDAGRLPEGEGARQRQKWDSRGHFFAAAATAMRRILVERARHKARERHGGGLVRREIGNLEIAQDVLEDNRLLALDESLSILSGEDPDAARVVELHHFAGLSHEQVAQVMNITVYEARQKWTYARAWLQTALTAE
jgi:RNA polymerase sigma factor (sigma-70 family)